MKDVNRMYSATRPGVVVGVSSLLLTKHLPTEKINYAPRKNNVQHTMRGIYKNVKLYANSQRLYYFGIN
jgi:hypothetical protein